MLLFSTSSAKIKYIILADIAQEISNGGVENKSADDVRIKFLNLKY